MPPLRLGLKNSGQATTIEGLRDVWRIADEGGFDHVWDFDHLASIGADGTERPVYEGWSLLAAIAASTHRVRFGCMVTGNTYRHPVVLAKMAVTVDHLSGGRLEFGIGAAWAAAEHRMYGIEGLDHRVGRLRESLEAMISLWTNERTTLDGRYYHFKDAVASPKPIQKPHPPIWIGAGGDQMMRVVARYADVWNSFGTVDEIRARNAMLTDLCLANGRDPSTIRRSLYCPTSMNPAPQPRYFVFTPSPPAAVASSNAPPPRLRYSDVVSSSKFVLTMSSQPSRL